MFCFVFRRKSRWSTAPSVQGSWASKQRQLVTRGVRSISDLSLFLRCDLPNGPRGILGHYLTDPRPWLCLPSTCTLAKCLLTCSASEFQLLPRTLVPPAPAAWRLTESWRPGQLWPEGRPAPHIVACPACRAAVSPELVLSARSLWTRHFPGHTPQGEGLRRAGLLWGSGAFLSLRERSSDGWLPSCPHPPLSKVPPFPLNLGFAVARGEGWLMRMHPS